MLAHLPNALTLLRIALAPLVVWLIAHYHTGHADWARYAAFWVFAFAAILDFFDGALARRLGATSDFGAALDPIADKILVGFAMIAILVLDARVMGTEAPLGPFPIVPMLIILGRDLTIAGLREHMALKGRRLAPTVLAKWKSAIEMLALAILLWPYAQDTSFLERFIGMATLWLAAGLSLLTGLLYWRQAFFSKA